MPAPDRPLFADLRASPLLATLLVVGIALAFFVGLGNVPLFDLDEGAFSEATREMLERGDYISTFLNGEPRYDKPVLIYWLQAVSVLAFGVTEFAFRLPSAICATVWVAIVFLFVRRLRGTEAGLLAAGLTATAAGVTVIGRAAIADALLNMLITAAITSAYLYITEKDARWLRASFIAIGFGLLAKGPVAVLVPLATTFIYCALKRDLKTWFRAVFDWRGIALMLVIAAPWYAAQYAKEGDAFVRGFLMKHNVERFSAPMHGFDGSLFFYVPWLFGATLPHVVPLLNALRGIPRAWGDDLQRFCLIWFGFVFAFFSFSGTKLPHYVFYGYTGLFIVMALQVPRLKSHALALLPATLVFAALAALPFGLEAAIPGLRDAYYREALTDIRAQFGPAYYACTALLVVGTIALMRVTSIGLPAKLLATGAGMAAMFAVFILPIAGEAQQAPIKEAALLARANNWHAVMYGLNTPSYIVYRGELTPRRDPVPGDIALTKTKRLVDIPHHEILYRRHGIALVRVLPPPADAKRTTP
jgi:4-amino-4-deoxy-L-arabinose transferase-like glycosyltransferase